MNYLSDPFAAINHRLEYFKAPFSDAVSAAASDKRLAEGMVYASLGGGKGIRPYLILAIGDNLGISREQLLPAAIAVEMIHAYSLVHDDLPAMDDDDLRRGRPTVHRAFDEALAILVGDALLTEAFSQLAKADILDAEKRIDLIQLLSKSAGAAGMVAGQVKDIAAEGADHTSLEEMHEIQLLKTGAIFEYCAIAPAIIAGCGMAQRRELQVFSRHLGALFQLSDDVIGVISDPDISGKPNDSDSRNGKQNFVSQFGVEAAQQECQKLAHSAQQSLIKAGVDNTELQDLLAWIAIRDR